MHYINFDRKLLIIGMVTLLISCSREGVEIPITTQSEEARALFLEGRDLIDNLRIEESRVKIDEAIRLDPGFAMGYYYRSRMPVSPAERQKNIRRAVQYSSKASDGERLMIKALQATNEGEYEKAVDIISKLIQLYPDDGRGYWQMAQYLIEVGMIDEAISNYEKAIKVDKTFPPPYNNLGYLLRDLGKYKEAEKAFKAYIRLIPDEPNPYDSIGDLYLRMGNYELAIANYEKALEINADFITSRRHIGISNIFLGQFEEARAILLGSENNTWSPKLQADDLILYAMSYNYEGKPKEAAKAIGLYIEKAADTNNIRLLAQAYLYLAMTNVINNEIEGARANLAKLAAIAESEEIEDYQRNEYKYQLGTIPNILLAQEGDDEQGLKNMIRFMDEMIATEDVNQARFSAVLGFIYFEAGNFTKAISVLSKGNAKDPIILYVRAASEERLGNDNEARAIYSDLANLNQNSLGYSLVRHKALEALQR